MSAKCEHEYNMRFTTGSNSLSSEEPGRVSRGLIPGFSLVGLAHVIR